VGAEGEGEAGSLEPDPGLHPGTLG